MGRPKLAECLAAAHVVAIDRTADCRTCTGAEQYAATAKSSGAGDGRVTRLLVLLDAEKPIKYPLYKDDMTIGRADFADIQIDSHFISRLHARLVTTPEGIVVEDIDSKNGVKINAKPATRQALSHGDLIALGGLRFRFLEAGGEDT